MNLTIIFMIAGMGIGIAIIEEVLATMGKPIIAKLINVMGVVIALFVLVNMISQLFQSVKTLFQI